LVYKIISGGHVGWGESTLNYNCLGVAKRIAKGLVGGDVSKRERLLDPKLLKDSLLYQYYAGFNRRFRQVREGFSQALWDLHGKVTNRSFAEMVNNGWPSAIPFQSGMPVIHVYTPIEMAEIAEIWMEQGFRKFKLKLRGDAEQDIRAMKMIKSLGSDVEILIGDANYGYKSIAELSLAAKGFRGCGLGYLQNPIRRPFWQYQGISKNIGIKLTSDNTAYWPNTKRVIHFREAELINLHPNIMGGIDYMTNAVNYSRVSGVPTITGSSGFFGIQDKCYQKVSFSIASSFPTENIGLQNYFCDSFKKYYKYEYDSPSLLKNDLEVKDGSVFDRYETGFGIDVDDEKLNRVCKQTMVYT